MLPETVKIVIIEDDITVVHFLHKILTKEGFNVVAHADTVSTALTAVQTYQPTLALLDIDLYGELSGIELAKILRSHFAIGVIFVSGTRSQELLSALAETQALGFIGKPFDTYSLLAQIHIALRLLQSEADKATSQAQLHAVLRSLPEAVISTNNEGMICFVSRSCQLLLNTKPEELLGKYISAIIEPRLVDSAGTPFSLPSHSDVGHRYYAGLQLLHPNTVASHIELTIAPVHIDSSDKIEGIIYILHDVSLRHQHEQALLAGEEKIHLLADNIPGIVYSSAFNESGDDIEFSYVNNSITNITAQQKDDFLRKKSQYSDFIHPDDKKMLFDTLRKAAEQNGTYSVEYRVLTATGEWRTLRDYGGISKEGVFHGAAFDITPTLALEQERSDMQRTLHSLRFALDQAAIVAMTNSAGVIEYVNEKFCSISGYTSHELLGQTHRVVRSDVHPQDFFRELWETITAGNIWQGEICNRRKDGTHYWVQSTIVPLKNELGKPEKYVSIRFDITSRKAYEEEIRILNKNLENRVAERTKELALMNKEKDEILAITVHDMKNPLAGIMLTAGLVRQCLEKQQYHKAHNLIERIESTVRQMSEIIGNMLKYSALESGYFTLQMEFCDVDELLANVIEQYTYTSRRKNITLEYHPHPEHRIVFADSLALSQIFDNLLSNAIKYSFQNTSVCVQTVEQIENDKKYIVVHFKDQGPGLTEGDKEKLFQKFQRLSAKPTAGEHSNGLGLSIVKRLAESMGCTIHVASEFGKGAIFSLWIPSSSSTAEA